MPPTLQFLILLLLGWVNRQQQAAIGYLLAENRVLREQLPPSRLRLTDAQRRRLAAKAKPLGRERLLALEPLVTPDTLLRWYRRLAARRYDSSGAGQRKPGRPRTRAELADLVAQVASENPTFGYTRIRDTLGNLGHELARSTVAAILARRGIEPAPERRRKTTWKQFLRAHADAIVAADFFTVEVLTLRGPVRYFVFFLLEHATRRVHVAGISSAPDGTWMQQIARNLTDPVDGFLRGKRYLILDRDPLYTEAFRACSRAAASRSSACPPAART
ncbi:MAG: hypothetical protein AB7N76_03920 [Planctomycetota bacterium]